MKKISLILGVAIFAIVLMSCEKEEMTVSPSKNSVDSYNQVKKTLIQEDYKIPDGGIGDLYETESGQLFIEVNGEEAYNKVNYDHHTYTVNQTIYCEGDPRNCHKTVIDGVPVIIIKAEER